MRKLSMNRPSKLNLAAKKVSPPSLPPPLPGELAASPSYNCYADWSLPPLPPQQQHQRPSGFNESFYPPPPPPLPQCSPSPSNIDDGASCSSSSAYSSSSLLSSVSSPGCGVPNVPPAAVNIGGGGGSRHSVSSMDSGWSGGYNLGEVAMVGSGGPVLWGQLRQCRNSNSSLNSDHNIQTASAAGLNHTNGDAAVQLRAQRPQQPQRRFSSISNSSSGSLRETHYPPPQQQSQSRLSNSSSVTTFLAPAASSSCCCHHNASFSSSSSSASCCHARPTPPPSTSSATTTNGSTVSLLSLSGPRRPSSRSSCGSSSGSSSLAAYDMVSSLDYREMIREGVRWEEVLNCWLTDLRYSEYYSLFVSAGYDLQTITRMTPEDFTAVGIKKPNHRKRLKAAAEELTVGDGLPTVIPGNLPQLLQILRLEEYAGPLQQQGYRTVEDLMSLSIEDLEDVGFFKLGHQKRLLLGMRRIKELKQRGGPSSKEVQVEYHLPPPNHHHQHHSHQQHQQQLQSFRLSSFHQEPAAAEMVWQRRDPQHQQQQDIMPRPMPPIEPIYASSRSQRYERCQSEDIPLPPPPTAIASSSGSAFWGRFRSYDDAELAMRRSSFASGGNNNSAAADSYQSGSLPRPRATVKPLPSTTSIEQQIHHHHHLEPLCEMRKPNFSSSLAENDGLEKELLLAKTTSSSSCYEGMAGEDPEDQLMPFANERAGTIKYKTNPQVAYEQYQYEQDVAESGEENPPNQESQAKPPANEEQSKGSALDESRRSISSSLLKTPSRAPNRSAADVLVDIGTMLTDLTEELDSMLKLDKA